LSLGRFPRVIYIKKTKTLHHKLFLSPYISLALSFHDLSVSLHLYTSLSVSRMFPVLFTPLFRFLFVSLSSFLC